MPVEITMPRLSDTMEEGTLIKWRVNVGDSVSNGDVLADVETDKATMELQSYDDGTVALLGIEEGQSAPVGRLILLLAEEGESAQEAIQAAGVSPAASASSSEPAQAAAAGGSDAGSSSATAVAASPTKPSGSVAPQTTQTGRVRISPLARKLAEEHELDPATIRGTGPDGRVIKRDVLAAASGDATLAPDRPVEVATATPAPESSAGSGPSIAVPSPTAPAMTIESKLVAVSNMRKTIARRLSESKATIPHFATSVTIDMAPLVALREMLNEQLAASASPDHPAPESAPVKLSVNDFIVRASALALVQHPMVNSSWTDDGIQVHGHVNVGVAVALPEQRGGGLVVPTIRDAHVKGLRQISTETRTLAHKARNQGLTVQEMSEGTFTVSNLGMLGVDHFEAIINPPQAAILAIGAAIDKPVVRHGQLSVGSEMTATLSADHRVVDGVLAAQWLATLRQLLENPAVLLV